MQELAPEPRSRAASPLFQVIFTLQNAPRGAARACPGLAVARRRRRQRDASSSTSTLVMAEARGGLGGVASSTRPISSTPPPSSGWSATSRRCSRASRRTRRAGLGELPLLGDEERRRLLVDVERDAAAATASDACVHDALRGAGRRDARTRSRVVAGGDAPHVPRARRAREPARAPPPRGSASAPTSVVGLCLRRGRPTLVVGLLGVLKAGGAYLPLDPGVPAAAPRADRSRTRARASWSPQDAPRGRAPGAAPRRAPRRRRGRHRRRERRAPRRRRRARRTSPTCSSPRARPGSPRASPSSTGSLVRLRARRRARASTLPRGRELRARLHVRRPTSATRCSSRRSASAARLHVIAGGARHRSRRRSARYFAARGRRLPQDRALAPRRAALGRAPGAGRSRARLLVSAARRSSWELVDRVERARAGDAHPQPLRPDRDHRRRAHLRGRARRGASAGGRSSRSAARSPDARVYVLDARAGARARRRARRALRRRRRRRARLPGPARADGGALRPRPFAAEPGARLYRTGDRARWLAGRHAACSSAASTTRSRSAASASSSARSRRRSRAHPACARRSVVAAEDAPGEQAPRGLRRAADAGAAPSRRCAPSSASACRSTWCRRRSSLLDALPLTPNGKIDRRALPALGARRERRARRRRAAHARRGGARRHLGRGASSASASASTTASPISAATRSSPSRSSRASRDAFGVEVPLRALFEAPTVAGARRARRGARCATASGAAAPPLARAPRERRPRRSRSRRSGSGSSTSSSRAAPSYNVPARPPARGAARRGRARARARARSCAGTRCCAPTFAAVDGRAGAGGPRRASTCRLPVERPRRAARRRRARPRAARPTRRRSGPSTSRAGPLVRARLLALAPEEHVLLLTLHHIVSDGWTQGVLDRELGALYEAFRAGRPSPLPELPVQYADYAAWQRALARGRGRSSGSSPTGRRSSPARPPRSICPRTGRARRCSTHRGARRALRALPPELARGARGARAARGRDALHDAARGVRRAAPPLHGPGAISWWARPSRAARAPRPRALIGFFVNTLVLRAELDGDAPFRELLARVREACLGAYAHQDMPFERLVQELAPERDLGRTPLFQVMFTLQNAPGGGAAPARARARRGVRRARRRRPSSTSRSR